MTSQTNNNPAPPQDHDAEFENASYYYGLPSQPVLVYRTGSLSKRPTGPEAYRVPKETRPVHDHPIADVWGTLGRQVLEYLDSVNVQWTSIDVVRFVEAEKEPGPPVVWIGVRPGSLSRTDAEAAAHGCEELLKKFELAGVEVAFRESVVTRARSAAVRGPQLLDCVCSESFHATAGVRGPLTPALGLQNAAKAIPFMEGTGTLCVRERSDSAKVFVLTARHVVLPPGAWPNEPYTREDAKSRGAMDDKDDTTRAKGEQRMVEGLVREEEKAVETLDAFHTEVAKYWSAECLRALGHIAYSPPVSVGTGIQRFTEDWALIELDGEKVDWKTFKGNVIDLGTKIPADEFTQKVYPNPAAPTSLKYPPDRLLPLQAIVTDDELRHPTTRDANGDPCLFVVKNGAGTAVTVGRASGTMSFVREYLPSGERETSMELAVHPYGHTDGAFSAPGDSGAIIADLGGRIVGLLTGGSGEGDATDVTYATPFYWLWEECIKKRFPDACLY